MDTEEELDFIKHALGFLYSNYNQNYTLGGSTASDPGPIDYSKYIKNDDVKHNFSTLVARCYVVTSFCNI